MNNDNVKKMADLLRSGNKMLNKSCPECNSPIFQNKEGELFCPTCNRKVVILKNEKSSKKQIATKAKNISEKNIQEEIKVQTRNTLKKKIDWILNEIDSETQIENVKKLLAVLEKIYHLLSYINSNKKQ